MKWQDILGQNREKVHLVNSEENKVIGISDNEFSQDKGKGGAYYFYPGGQLKSYKYFRTDLQYDYEEEYDQNGKLLKIIGSPLVDKRISEINIDSAFIRFCLFSLRKSYYNVKITTSQNIQASLDVKKDKYFSNIKVASIGMNTKGLSQFTIYFSCEYEDECTLKEETITDTLSFVKNPRLNLVSMN